MGSCMGLGKTNVVKLNATGVTDSMRKSQTGDYKKTH